MTLGVKVPGTSWSSDDPVRTGGADRCPMFAPLPTRRLTAIGASQHPQTASVPGTVRKVGQAGLTSAFQRLAFQRGYLLVCVYRRRQLSLARAKRGGHYDRRRLSACRATPTT